MINVVVEVFEKHARQPVLRQSSNCETIHEAYRSVKDSTKWFSSQGYTVRFWADGYRSLGQLKKAVKRCEEQAACTCGAGWNPEKYGKHHICDCLVMKNQPR